VHQEVVISNRTKHLFSRLKMNGQGKKVVSGDFLGKSVFRLIGNDLDPKSAIIKEGDCLKPSVAGDGSCQTEKTFAM